MNIQSSALKGEGFVHREAVEYNQSPCRLTLRDGLGGYEVAKEVTISYTIGDVRLVRGGRKRLIEAVPFKKSVRLKDGDRIVTSARSYVFDLSDEPGPFETGTMITAFSNSEFALGIKGLIRSVELVRGLFRIITEKEVITPTAEIRFPEGSSPFWVDVSKDGAVVVASEAAPVEVLHKETKKGVVIGFKQQVTVTEEGILEPCLVDQRLKKAYGIYQALSQSQSKFIFGDMVEGGVPQGTEEITRIIEKATGEKQDYDREKHEKWLKEQRDLGEQKFREAVETELPEFKADEEVKPVFKAKPRTVEIDKTVNYAGIEFKVGTLERVQEFKGREAPEGKDFLIVNVEAKNNSQKQVYVFYDEEVRLINEDGENVLLENYQMETSFDTEAEHRGSFAFVVPGEETKFRLQFGKKSLPKVDLDLS